jgi:hypothetical protein
MLALDYGSGSLSQKELTHNTCLLATVASKTEILSTILHILRPGAEPVPFHSTHVQCGEYYNNMAFVAWKPIGRGDILTCRSRQTIVGNPWTLRTISGTANTLAAQR